MLQWFSKLSSVEKCAAMAIYDDSIFIQFYIDLYKLHIKSVKEVGNFSLFSKETVHHYYEIAKTAQKKSKISKKPLANFSSDSSTLEYLTGTNRELHDIDEFENPFDIESMQSVSPTSTQLCARAVHSRNLTYLVAAANVEDILGVAMENATRKIERKGLSAGSFLRYLSDNLHKSILLASANGSETDTLFCRYGTNDVSKFIKMTNVLSSNHMFTHVPSPNEIKALMSGKPFPDLKWVQYPVACYNLLLARIEISMWAAFYACGGNIESPGTTLLPIANTADKENNRVSSIDSRYGLSTGMNIKKKDNSASSTIVPLSSLSQSPLLKLHSAAAMLTLGCIVEELKLFWSRLSDRSKTDLMVDTPQMLAHHSDLRRCYQRSETVIDRAVLCPFEWAIQQDSSAHSQLMLDRLKALRADASMRELLSEEVEGIQSKQIENPYHTAVRQDKNNSNSNSNNSTAPSVPHTRASTDQNQTAVSTHPTLKFRGSSVAVQSRAASKELNIIAPLVTTALTPALPTSTPSTLDQSTSFLNLPATSHESFRFHFNHLGPTDDPSMEQLLRDERQIGAEGKSSAPDIEAPAAVKKKRKNKKKKKKSVANIESTSIGILSSEVALDDDGNDEDDDDDRVNESSAEEVNSPIITEPNLITETVTPLEEVNPKDISKSIDQSPAIVASISTLPLELKTVEVKMPVPNVSEIDMNRDVSDHKMFSASDMHGYADSDMYEIILDGRPLLEDEGGFVTVQHRKETKPKQQPPQKPQQQSQFQPPLHHQQQQTSQSRSKASETSQDSKASNASSNIKKKEKQVVPEKSSTVSKKTSPTAKPAVVPKTVATVSKVTTSSPSVVQPALSAQTDSKVTVPDRTEFEFLGDATIPVIELSSTSEVVPPTIPAPSLEKPIEVTEAPISLETLATTSNVVAPPEVSMPITASVEDVITDEAGAEDISTHATTQVASDQERARQSMDFEPFYLESSSTSDNPRKGSAAAATAVHANAKTQIQEENTLQLQRRLTKNIRRFNTTMSHRMDVHKMTQVAVLYEVQAIASAIWPRAAVRVFGSSLTGLVLPTSDIDLVIQLSPADGGETAASQLLSATQDSASVLGDTVYSSMASHSLDSEEAPQYLHERGRSYSMGSEDVPPSMTGPHTHGRHSASKAFQSPASIPFPVINPDTESRSSHRMGSVGDSSSHSENLPSQSDVIRCLHAVAAELYSRKWASEVNPIQTASIPVIKLNVKSDVLIAAARSNYSHMVVQTQQVQAQAQQQPYIPVTPQPSPVPTKPIHQQHTPTQYRQTVTTKSEQEFNVPTVVWNTESTEYRNTVPVQKTAHQPPSPMSIVPPPSTPILESSPSSERSRNRPQMLPHPRPFPIPTPEMDPAIFSMLHHQALEHALKTTIGTSPTPSVSGIQNTSLSSVNDNTFSIGDPSRQIGLRKSPAASTQIMTIEHSRQMQSLRKSPAANTSVNLVTPRSRYDSRSSSFDNTVPGPYVAVQNALDDSMNTSFGSSAAPTPSRPGIAEVGNSIATSCIQPVNFAPPGAPAHYYSNDTTQSLPPPSPHSAAQIQALIPPPRRPTPQAPLNNSIRPLSMSDMPVETNPATFEEYAMLHHQFHGGQFNQAQQQQLSPHIQPQPHMQPHPQGVYHQPNSYLQPLPPPPPHPPVLYSNSRLTSPVQQYGKSIQSQIPYIDTKFDTVSSGEAASGFDLNTSGSSDPRYHYGMNPHDGTGYSPVPGNDAYPQQSHDQYFHSQSPPQSPYVSVTHSHMSSPHTIPPQSPHSYSFHSLSHTPMSSFPPTPRSAGHHPAVYCPDGSLIGVGYGGGYPVGPPFAGNRPPGSYVPYGADQAYMQQQQVHPQQFQEQFQRHLPPEQEPRNFTAQSQYQPRTPQASYLPFHQALPQAKGVVIPVDITIEAHEHKGISTCDYIQHVLRTQSHAIPSVVKVVKYLLVNAGLNVPFNGGLSSYSVFLLVCAAYESLQQEANTEAESNVVNNRVKGRLNTLLEGEDSTTAASVSSPLNLKKVSRMPVTEGRLLLHFLKMFGRDFDPSVQGVDVPGSHPVLFILTPEEQVAVGTSAWVRDPLDPSKNVSRPSFMFRQIQETFSQYLTTLERENIKANHIQYASNHTLTNGPIVHNRGNHFLQNHFLTGSRIPPQVPLQSGHVNRPGFHNSFYPGMNNNAAQVRANKTFQKYNMFNTTRAGNNVTVVNDEPDLLGSLLR